MKLPSTERRKASQVAKRTLLIYGKPFSGKSTLADGAPVPLFLNTDGNATYLTAPYVAIKDEITQEGRMIKRTFAWEIFKSCIDELEKKENDFKTIVVDLLEDTYEYCRLYMYHKLGISHESEDGFRAWDLVRTEYLSNIRRLMNLPYENILLLSHEDTTKDITKKAGDKITAIRPALNEKCANKVTGMVGMVGRVVVDGSKRTLQFKTDDHIFGGGRLKTNVTEVPLEWAAVAKLFDEKEGK